MLFPSSASSRHLIILAKRDIGDGTLYSTDELIEVIDNFNKEKPKGYSKSHFIEPSRQGTYRILVVRYKSISFFEDGQTCFIEAL